MTEARPSPPEPSTATPPDDGRRRELRTFALPATVISFGGYLVISALAGFTHVLDVHVGGALTLTLLLLILLFPLVWILAAVHGRRVARREAGVRS
jgi:uncharacterized membrane protein (DUF485 family)